MQDIIACLATALLILNAVPVFAGKPGAMVGQERTDTGTVAAVNKGTREVTLKQADGQEIVVKAGPEVRNFAQIEVGDKVTATTHESLAVYVTPPGEAPSSSETEVMERAALGEKPAGYYSRTVDISATVEALDLENRKVTLRGPKGNTVTLDVGDHVKRLDKVEVGDMVKAEYTEIIEISVSKP